MSKKLSGSEYRKRAAKKQNDELETLQKVPKIGSFFKSVDLTDPKTSESTSLKLDFQEGIQIQEEGTSTTCTSLGVLERYFGKSRQMFKLLAK